MKALLVDDHQLFRSGLKSLLAGLRGDIEIIEANDCEAAIALEDKEKIELVLLDLYLPGTEGFEALQLVKENYPCCIVVLSSEDDPKIIRSAIAQGAAGFIPKSSSAEVLVAALQLVLADGIYLPPHVLSDYTDSTELFDGELDKQRKEILGQLTPRQLEVLAMAARGKPNKIIARELNISASTVKVHLSACYEVLKVSNRTEAVYATASLGLFSN